MSGYLFLLAVVAIFGLFVILGESLEIQPRGWVMAIGIIMIVSSVLSLMVIGLNSPAPAMRVGLFFVILRD